MGLLNFFPFKKKRGTIYVNNHDSFYTFDNTTLASNETIFAAVSLLANAMASAPVSLRKGYEKVAPRDHPIAELLKFGLCPDMTTFDFIRSMEAQRCSEGSAYAIKHYDADHRVDALYLLKSREVFPMIEKGSNELYYRIYDDEGNHLIHSEHFIKTSFISADGYTKGINPISVLRNTLDYDREIKTFSIDQLKNGVRPNMVITVNDELTPEKQAAYDAMISNFRKSGILFLDTDKTFKEVQQGISIDAKVFDAEQITIKKVASVFSIPVSKLWGGEKYDSAEEDDLAYLKDTILPTIRMYEQAFEKGLLTRKEILKGYSVKFSMNGYARANMSARGEFYFKGSRTGWFNANEIREWEDMPPYEGGDVYYVSKDLIPADLLPQLALKEINGTANGGDTDERTENSDNASDAAVL